MTDHDTTPEPVAPRRRPHALVALAAGSLAGLVLGMGGIASAQEATPTPAPSTTAPQEAPDTTTEDGDGEKEPCDEPGATADGTADDAA